MIGYMGENVEKIADTITEWMIEKRNRIKRNYLVVILISISIFTMLLLAACSSKDNINITPSPETAQVVSEMQSDAAM